MCYCALLLSRKRVEFSILTQITLFPPFGIYLISFRNNVVLLWGSHIPDVRNWGRKGVYSRGVGHGGQDF